MTNSTITHCKYPPPPSGRSAAEGHQDSVEFGCTLHRSPLDIFEAVKDFESQGYFEQYTKNFGVSRYEAKTHLVEVLKYLSLLAAGRTNLTPSEQLDEAWHALIIQTRDYMKLCELLGKFVHHTTKEGPQHGQYKRCLSAYREWFGDLHPVWEMANLNKLKVIPVGGDSADFDITGWCSDNDGSGGGDDGGGGGDDGGGGGDA